MRMREPYYWRAEDLAQVIACSKSKAYKLVQLWNKELAALGYHVQSGRVPRQYAIDRLGLEARWEGAGKEFRPAGGKGKIVRIRERA